MNVDSPPVGDIDLDLDTHSHAQDTTGNEIAALIGHNSLIVDERKKPPRKASSHPSPLWKENDWALTRKLLNLLLDPSQHILRRALWPRVGETSVGGSKIDYQTEIAKLTLQGWEQEDHVREDARWYGNRVKDWMHKLPKIYAECEKEVAEAAAASGVSVAEWIESGKTSTRCPVYRELQLLLGSAIGIPAVSHASSSSFLHGNNISVSSPSSDLHASQLSLDPNLDVPVPSLHMPIPMAQVLEKIAIHTAAEKSARHNHHSLPTGLEEFISESARPHKYLKRSRSTSSASGSPPSSDSSSHAAHDTLKLREARKQRKLDLHHERASRRDEMEHERKMAEIREREREKEREFELEKLRLRKSIVEGEVERARLGVGKRNGGDEEAKAFLSKPLDSPLVLVVARLLDQREAILTKHRQPRPIGSLQEASTKAVVTTLTAISHPGLRDAHLTTFRQFTVFCAACSIPVFPIAPEIVALWMYDGNCATFKTIVTMESVRLASLDVWENEGHTEHASIAKHEAVRALRNIDEEKKWNPVVDPQPKTSHKKTMHPGGTDSEASVSGSRASNTPDIERRRAAILVNQRKAGKRAPLFLSHPQFQVSLTNSAAVVPLESMHRRVMASSIYANQTSRSRFNSYKRFCDQSNVPAFPITEDIEELWCHDARFTKSTIKSTRRVLSIARGVAEPAGDAESEWEEDDESEEGEDQGLLLSILWPFGKAHKPFPIPGTTFPSATAFEDTCIEVALASFGINTFRYQVSGTRLRLKCGRYNQAGPEGHRCPFSISAAKSGTVWVVENDGQSQHNHGPDHRFLKNSSWRPRTKSRHALPQPVSIGKEGYEESEGCETNKRGVDPVQPFPPAGTAFPSAIAFEKACAAVALSSFGINVFRYDTSRTGRFVLGCARYNYPERTQSRCRFSIAASRIGEDWIVESDGHPKHTHGPDPNFLKDPSWRPHLRPEKRDRPRCDTGPYANGTGNSMDVSEPPRKRQRVDSFAAGPAPGPVASTSRANFVSATSNPASASALPLSSTSAPRFTPSPTVPTGPPRALSVVDVSVLLAALSPLLGNRKLAAALHARGLTNSIRWNTLVFGDWDIVKGSVDGLEGEGWLPIQKMKLMKGLEALKAELSD
ncbi:hypothetical protein P7C70_g5767, partial [Phenoliferia sp. Uapishka_3]